MKIINIKTPEDKENIIAKLQPYLENTPHNIVNFFEYYSSSQIGIHIYINKYKIKGYYEDGTFTRFGDLQRAKSIFYFKILDGASTTKIYGIILFSPFISAAIIIALLTCIYDLIYTPSFSSIVAIILTVIVSYNILKPTFKNQKLIYEKLLHLFTKNWFK